ncbi:MAG TPA: hypothetical protein VH598_14100 [Verrucomicrobiae bacterium]|nr:hypothetical protein [Verrucomicrobiae bacterium]
MKKNIARWLNIGMIGTGLLFPLPPRALARQNNSGDDRARLATEEKDECVKHLTTIYEAIQAYQADHKDIPNWLSDLVPQYISDPSILICPAVKRTGQAEIAFLSDPKISTSYLYEFCPVPIGASAPGKTRRDWKRRQMGLVGSVVPIVRCRRHGGVILNLAFDGKIYESGSRWEDSLTNRFDVKELNIDRIFANDTSPATAAPPVLRFPKRDSAAPPDLISLTDFYNALLTDSWHGSTGNDLAALPSGLQTLAGVQWDVRGIVQLASKSPSSKKFPEQVIGIKVNQKCRKLNFLHAAGFGRIEDEGAQIGVYIIHIATNHMRMEVPIVYGQDVRNWHVLKDEPPAKDLVVAWNGDNEVSKRQGHSLRLFKTTWVNILPDVPIETIDFVSSLANPAPFLIAITAE